MYAKEVIIKVAEIKEYKKYVYVYLMKISNLIGNAEKKGLCHVLVNDGKIQTWVDIDEW